MRQRFTPILTAVLTVFVCSVLGRSALAQNHSPFLVGRVVTEMGNGLEKMSVTLSMPGHEDVSATTDARGEFSFTGTPPIGAALVKTEFNFSYASVPVTLGGQESPVTVTLTIPSALFRFSEDLRVRISAREAIRDMTFAHVRVIQTQPPPLCGLQATSTVNHIVSVLSVFRGTLPSTLWVRQAAFACTLLHQEVRHEIPWAVNDEFIVSVYQHPTEHVEYQTYNVIRLRNKRVAGFLDPRDPYPPITLGMTVQQAWDALGRLADTASPADPSGSGRR